MCDSDIASCLWMDSIGFLGFPFEARLIPLQTAGSFLYYFVLPQGEE